MSQPQCLPTLSCPQDQPEWDFSPPPSPPSSGSVRYTNPVLPQFSLSLLSKDLPQGQLSLSEQQNFYHGSTPTPPHLFNRSDVEESPFSVHPQDINRFLFRNLVGLNHPCLKNDLWVGTICPKIVNLLQVANILPSSLLPVRFGVSTGPEDPVVADDQVVLWATLYPGTTTPQV